MIQTYKKIKNIKNNNHESMNDPFLDVVTDVFLQFFLYLLILTIIFTIISIILLITFDKILPEWVKIIGWILTIFTSPIGGPIGSIVTIVLIIIMLLIYKKKKY